MQTQLKFSLTKETAAAMEDLQARTGCSSLAELLKRSLQTYDSLTEMFKGGTRLVAHHPDGRTEILSEKSLGRPVVARD